MTPAEIRADITDSIALTCTLAGECAGEPIQGVLGVACVIRNRVHADLHGDKKPDWWGEGYKGVCLAPDQFSCWWEYTAQNTQRVYAMAEHALTTMQITTLEIAMHLIVDAVMNETVMDITNGSTHYLTTNLLRAAPPKWTIGRKPVAVLGAHSFFAGIEK